MNWLVEEPGYAIAFGVIGACAFGFAWLQTSSSRWLICAFSVVGLSSVLVVLERWVETDREQIQWTLHRLATAMEHSDIGGIGELLHPQANTVRQDANYYLKRFTFHRIVIKPNLRIQVDRQAGVAVADFNALLIIQGASDPAPRRMGRYLLVWFRDVNGSWLVERYRQSNAIDGVTKRGRTIR